MLDPCTILLGEVEILELRIHGDERGSYPMIEGFRPLQVRYAGGGNARRLAGALLIPVWRGKSLSNGIFKPEEKEEEREIHEPEFVQ